MAGQESTHALDHLGLAVSDLARAKAFYAAALDPLGFGIVMEFPGAVGLGPPGRPQLWLHQGTPAAPVHIALHAQDEAHVQAFHTAALEAGAIDNGAPGLRPHYHPGYYAAYVRDPDGNNLEAVVHGEPPGR
jgi:catechol 2,3-dioxygenase-like lactoylglutathione lyase family enzyme